MLLILLVALAGAAFLVALPVGAAVGILAAFAWGAAFTARRRRNAAPPGAAPARQFGQPSMRRRPSETLDADDPRAARKAASSE